MDRKGKGKQIAGTKSSSSAGKKRKVGGVEFRDEGLRTSKRRNPEVLQFFEESTEVGYYGESSDDEIDNFLNDMEEDEPEVEASSKDDKGKKSKSSYVFPKEEEINEDEYDRIMEERYRPGSGFIRYADDDVKDSIEMDALAPTKKDPPIWKVKCAIGREKHSVFCLMHKFVELRKIGNKLQILSVFFVEHVRGFIFIEADKEHDVLEACKSLTGIYATRMMLLPNAEAPHLLSVQRKPKTASEGRWARVKSGIYKGDLAQVVAVNDPRRKALIKLIPRIDMQALTQKYGGGVAVQKGPTPAPRLISSSEFEEFRPLIQVRRDRDTGMTFEHLDSLMLKDGYLYKKVSLDSLSSWGVTPTKEEILKFTPVEQKETDDAEWISEIYGDEKKKKVLPTGKGGGKGEASVGEKGEGSSGGKGEGSSGGKGEGSSGSKSESSYELYNLVCFSRKDFGLIVGVDDKGDGYKVLKEGSEGPVVVTVGKKEMMKGPFDSKFTALDLNNKQISINDVVKISKGPSEGKQGVVRQVYRGIIFLYDESGEENGGFFCCKSQSCEKIKLFPEESSEKTGGFDASAFGDSASSPKSPLSPEKEWQPKEKYINSSQGDKGNMYSIGQKLRIRVGPLKGYLCRVIALRYSDITVKLDSQHKIFTVKSEHLAEVRDRNTGLSTSGDAGTGSFQPFDMLGTEGSSGGWAKGAGTSGEGGNWNTGGAATDLGAWGSKPTVPDDNASAWGNAAAENKPASDWNSWGKTPASEAGTAGGWGDAGASKVEASSWGKQGASTSNVEDLGSWGKHGGSSDANKQDEDPVWGKLVQDSESKKEESSWGKKVESESGFGKGGGEPSWANKDGNSNASNKEGVSWGQQDKGSDGSNEGSAWGNQGGGFGSGEKKDASSGWNKSAKDSNANNKGVPGWGKRDGGSSWGQQDKGGSSQVEPDGGSSWGKKDDGNKDDGGSAWGKKDDGGSSWDKKDDSNKDDGGSSWGKKDDSNKGDGGSSWGKKNDGNKGDEGSTWGKKGDGGSSWAKKDDGGSSWGKKVDGGSSWAKKDDGGSSWGKKDDRGSSWSKKDDGGYSKQTFDRGGRGFGGRRGGRRGGRDQFGRGRSFGNSEDPAPWSKSGGRSSWGNQDSGGGGSSWGKQNDAGGGSSWSKQESGVGGSSWGKQDGGGGSSWGKLNDSGGGSSWSKQDGGEGGSSWGKQDGGGGGGGSSWGKQDGGGGGSSWGKQDSGGGGGSSWSKQGDGGSKPWNEQGGGGGGRGFGGRRGGGFRGGFRGGRNQGGRDGGRLFDRDQSSTWKTDNQENIWKSNQGGGGSDWKKGWGEDSNNRKPSDSSTGGGNWSSWGTDSKKETNAGENKAAAWGTGNDQANTGNWSSWGTDSRKETNVGGDKPRNENKAAAWGTGNGQANTGNNNDSWNKKPNDDVKTSGDADDAWGGKTNVGASSSSGSTWATGTGVKKSGW